MICSAVVGGDGGGMYGGICGNGDGGEGGGGGGYGDGGIGGGGRWCIKESAALRNENAPMAKGSRPTGWKRVLELAQGEDLRPTVGIFREVLSEYFRCATTDIGM